MFWEHIRRRAKLTRRSGGVSVRKSQPGKGREGRPRRWELHVGRREGVTWFWWDALWLWKCRWASETNIVTRMERGLRFFPAVCSCLWKPKRLNLYKTWIRWSCWTLWHKCVTSRQFSGCLLANFPKWCRLKTKSYFLHYENPLKWQYANIKINITLYLYYIILSWLMQN